MSLDRLRSVAAVLEVRLVLEPRWRGAAIDRFLSSGHAAMAEAVSRLLLDAGWEIRPEVSFNHFGERGIVDIVAWHAATRTVLIVELKTELADVNELLGVQDRRRRLAAKIVEPFGWVPVTISQMVVVADSRTNRRRLADHRTLLRAAFPSDGRSVAGWLARPEGPLSALWFLPNSGASVKRRAAAPRHRVRGAPPGEPRPAGSRLMPSPVVVWQTRTVRGMPYDAVGGIWQVAIVGGAVRSLAAPPRPRECPSRPQAADEAIDATTGPERLRSRRWRPRSKAVLSTTRTRSAPIGAPRKATTIEPKMIVRWRITTRP